MNTQHIISGWVAQLSLDATRERGGAVTRSRPEAPVVSSPVLFQTAAEAVAPVAASAPVAAVGASASVAPVAPVVPLASSGRAVVPARPRGRLLPVLARAREGAARRAVVQPCLGLG